MYNLPSVDGYLFVSLPQKYVRAHFNYSPKTDDEIPCQPLGLRFEKGDILEISNQDDPDWWQVYIQLSMYCCLRSEVILTLECKIGVVAAFF